MFPAFLIFSGDYRASCFRGIIKYILICHKALIYFMSTTRTPKVVLSFEIARNFLNTRKEHRLETHIPSGFHISSQAITLKLFTCCCQGENGISYQCYFMHSIRLLKVLTPCTLCLFKMSFKLHKSL